MNVYYVECYAGLLLDIKHLLSFRALLRMKYFILQP